MDSLGTISGRARQALVTVKGITPQSLLDTMLRIRARALTNMAFPVQVDARKPARVPMRRR